MRAVSVEPGDGGCRCHPRYEVVIDGRCVGVGDRGSCDALADELREDRSGGKADLVYSIFEEDHDDSNKG